MVKSCDDKPSGNSGCRFKGIRKRKWGRWVSEIRLPNSRERIWLGSYDAPEKAARAFDAAVFCLRGPDAKFNFPENLPVIDAPSSLTPVEIQEIAAKYANGDSAVVANPPQEQEQDQSLSESSPPSPPSPPSLVSNDNLSTHLDSNLDFSFVDMLTADSGENRFDVGIPRLYSDQFFTGFDLPAADFGEEFGFPQESFLWSF